jgi:hypothetical protein
VCPDVEGLAGKEKKKKRSGDTDRTSLLDSCHCKPSAEGAGWS